MRWLLALAALAQPVAARLLAEAAEKELEAEEEEVLVHYAIAIGVSLLGVTFVVGHVMEVYGVTWMPEAAVGVLTGLVAAGLCKATGQTHLLADERFDFEFFMTFLLPPIIFEAGFNLQVTPFVRNLAPTAFFAFIGTFLSTFVVGGLVYLAGQSGLCYPMGALASLTFGSLISATDPVTVIAVFNKIGVKVDLFSMVFGESVLNDAVAIVLSKTLLLFTTQEITQGSVLTASLLFVKIFAGSIAIGVAAGLLSSYVFKKLKTKEEAQNHHEHFTMEAALSFVFPWVAYFIAEALELSGLVAILICGMVMATYTRYNLSEKGAILTMRAYKAVAAIAETFVFVYLGMAMVSFPILSHTSSLNLLVFGLLACFVGRLHIPIGSALTNCFRGPGSSLPPISLAYQFIMWWSGLRGGVAFALAAKIYSDNNFPAKCGGGAELAGCDPNNAMNDSEAILQTTMLIAALTIFVFGGSITFLALKANVMETASGGGAKSDASIVNKELEENSQVMLQCDKNAFLLRLLTHETSYKQAAEDAKALEEEAFPSESHPGSSKGSRRPSKTSIELTSPPYTSTAGKATGQTFKGWLGGKLSTTTPPLN
uniref:Sodium/hydrogen exchanger n=1 Tax=Phaeocystis antarctica TaxID=33657 RepID=A0A7S0NFQ9_9EUKA